MKGAGYNEKVDVWSFGTVLYELTTNTIPYDYCKDNIPFLTKEAIHEKKILPIPEGIGIDSTLRDLMKQCWNWDPQQRPSFTQIVQALRNALLTRGKLCIMWTYSSFDFLRKSFRLKSPT
jgi:serine/threonine protein kinase